MTILQGIFLGIIQGLTEFLPISSSGHLVFFQKLWELPSDVTFDVMLHFGTLLSIVVYYFKDIINLFKYPFKTMGKLIIATIPACIALILLRDFFEGLFSGYILPFSFLFTAIILWLSSKSNNNIYKNTEITSGTALFMGIFQAVAIIPGISRSGMTISAGLFSGCQREEVGKFSFLMSIPIILGSIIISAMEGFNTQVSGDVAILGIATAFISGLFAIKLVTKLLQKAKMWYFSYYLIGIAILSFILI